MDTCLALGQPQNRPPPKDSTGRSSLIFTSRSLRQAAMALQLDTKKEILLLRSENVGPVVLMCTFCLCRYSMQSCASRLCRRVLRFMHVREHICAYDGEAHAQLAAALKERRFFCVNQMFLFVCVCMFLTGRAAVPIPGFAYMSSGGGYSCMFTSRNNHVRCMTPRCLFRACMYVTGTMCLWVRASASVDGLQL